MDNVKNDDYYIEIIKKDINKIIEYSKNVTYEDFINDDLMLDAVLFRLIQLAENIKKISIEFKTSHSNIDWSEIIGFRNRIVHEYGKTDYKMVYEIISKDIISLKGVFE